MGVALRDLIKSHEVDWNDLSGKVVVIDAFNMLYQFLTTIRSRDGSLLTDPQGRTTSHLIGLFSRMTNFLEREIKPVFVFDGPAPKLKQKERERRRAIKESAQAKYEIAMESEDEDSMKKFASQTTRLTSEMIESAKTLLKALGIPCIQAPSEGEAQTAYFVKKNKAHAAVSQDFDSLLFGCPLLIRNLSIAGRRKRIRGVGTITIKPERIVLAEVLNDLGIDQDGLIALGMLVGTDYNQGGIKGLGPKKSLKLVKEYQGRYEELFKSVQWDASFSFPWQDVFYLFKNIERSDEEFVFEKKDPSKVMALLVDEYGFDADRVAASLKRLEGSGQKGLGEFF